MSDYIELWDTARYKERTGAVSSQDFDNAFFAVENGLAAT
jgi:hypothetical protein